MTRAFNQAHRLKNPATHSTLRAGPDAPPRPLPRKRQGGRRHLFAQGWLSLSMPSLMTCSEGIPRRCLRQGDPKFLSRFDGWRDDRASYAMRPRPSTRSGNCPWRDRPEAKPTVASSNLPGAQLRRRRIHQLPHAPTMADLKGSAKGRYVGIGVKLGSNNQNNSSSRASPDSPAYGELKPFERITQSTARTSPIRIPTKPPPFFRRRRHLRGAQDRTAARADGYDDGHGRPIVKVQRARADSKRGRAVFITTPGDEMDKMRLAISASIASRYHASDLKSAILRLQSSGMEVLISNLRGNPGGSFPLARRSRNCS